MIIYCSKALQKALKLDKTEMATQEQLEIENDPFYAWHGHITKMDGRNMIILMNDKTMYSLIFRNKLPRDKEKFARLIMEALPYTFEVDNINGKEIDNYMKIIGDIIFSEKLERQITGNINGFILDMECQWEFSWNEDETIQAYEAQEQNDGLKKIGKDYVVPYQAMLKELCERNNQL